MKIDNKKNIWLPRRHIQLEMTAEEKEVDSYCRAVLGVLNKVTPQNIDRLLDRVICLCMNNELNIRKLVHYIIRKAADEPIYSEVYANLCRSLAQISDNEVREDVNIDNCKLFKRLLLTECEDKFKNIFIDSGDWTDIVKKKSEDVESYERLCKYRHSMFGIVTFIGHLCNVEFLPEENMRQYIIQLLDEGDVNAFEFQIECACKLLCIVGSLLDIGEMKREMDNYISKIDKIRCENEFCSRVKFAVLDVIELRERNWVSRWYKETPTTIDDIRLTWVPKSVKRKKKKNKKKGP